jgi:ABC-2 type transport system ATP-binding protein
MSQYAIEIRGLVKRFGDKTVLGDVTFQVPKGKTYAFLGRNGAGKTTTIRILLGLLRADGGQVSVLGLDPARQALEIRRRVGYLAEDQRMFGWMRVRQLLDFIAPFYPHWNHSLAERLAGRLELPMNTRVRHLSKGHTVRLGLLLAVAHRPELVILDDPTLGLDPIMRKEFLRDVVSYLQSIETTVFFSSHLLYEIEPVADMVGILEGGRIVLQSATDTLREQVKQLVLSTEDYRRVSPLPRELDVVIRGQQTAVVVADTEAACRAASKAGVRPTVINLNLDEIFEAYVTGKGEKTLDSQADLERVG